VQVGAQGMADRYTYLPLTGIFLALATALPGSAGRTPGACRAAAALAVTAVAGCALLSARQIGHWRDSGTLFSHALAVTRDNWMAHNVVGTTLMKEGRPAAAEQHFVLALAARPDYWTAQYNLGNSLLAQGKAAAAVTAYRRALDLDPLSAPTYNNLGAALLKLGASAEAERCFREALRIRPHFADALRNLELAQARSGP